MSDDNEIAKTRKLERKKPTVRITNTTSDAGGPAPTKPISSSSSPFTDYENRNGMPDSNDKVENRAGSDRPVTRVFGRAGPTGDDAADDSDKAVAASQDADNPVTGWLVIVDGPGRGNQMKIGYGMHHVGRDDTQDIIINFGDDSISRENHAKVEYDPETREFFIIKGDNRVYLNGNRVGAGGELEMKTGDEVKIGDTVMRFVAFCGPDFDWNDG